METKKFIVSGIIMSGEVSSLETVKALGFTDSDGRNRISTTGDSILTFNGRRCSPI